MMTVVQPKDKDSVFVGIRNGTGGRHHISHYLPNFLPMWFILWGERVIGNAMCSQGYQLSKQQINKLCCKLLSNFSVITVYSVVYCHSDSDVGYWSINITAFWKVIRLEHVILDAVASQSSQVTCYLGKVIYETMQPCGTQLGCRHTVCL